MPLVVGVVARRKETLREVEAGLIQNNQDQIRKRDWTGMLWLKDGTQIYFFQDLDVERVKAHRFDQLWLCGCPDNGFMGNVRLTDKVPEEWRIQYI